MSINPYLYRLSVLHRQLDEEMRHEMRRRGGDVVRVLRLKKLKLAVKNRLAAQMQRPVFTS